jgi:hypothetical protein
VNAIRHPLRAVEHEAHALLEIERAGESAESIFIAVLSVAAIVVPIAAVMMVLAIGAAWLFA